MPQKLALAPDLWLSDLTQSLPYTYYFPSVTLIGELSRSVRHQSSEGHQFSVSSSSRATSRHSVKHVSQQYFRPARSIVRTVSTTSHKIYKRRTFQIVPRSFQKNAHHWIIAVDVEFKINIFLKFRKGICKKEVFSTIYKFGVKNWTSFCHLG